MLFSKQSRNPSCNCECLCNLQGILSEFSFLSKLFSTFCIWVLVLVFLFILQKHRKRYNFLSLKLFLCLLQFNSSNKMPRALLSGYQPLLQHILSMSVDPILLEHPCSMNGKMKRHLIVLCVPLKYDLSFETSVSHSSYGNSIDSYIFEMISKTRVYMIRRSNSNRIEISSYTTLIQHWHYWDWYGDTQVISHA